MIWSYQIPGLPPDSVTSAQNRIKSVSLVSDQSKQIMTLRLEKHSPNRAIDSRCLHKYMSISFEKFRLQYTAECTSSEGSDNKVRPAPAKESTDYIERPLQPGIRLNGICYYSYGHSNSQLKSKTCFMLAGTPKSAAQQLESLADFPSKSVTKSSKRVGLLFSAAKFAANLGSDRCEDIADVRTDDYIFTDGCGIISTRFAKLLVQKTDIRFRNQRYTPSAFQIRYKGYKGVLTLSPALRGQILVKFRESVKKFSGCDDSSFSVVEYSKPYGFGYLNDEVILLLHALDISENTIVRKQKEYMDFLTSVPFDPRAAFRFFSYVDKPELAERVLMDGVDSVRPTAQSRVSSEVNKLLNKRGERRSRILIPQSRLLFGVCDPLNLLKAGECTVRVTSDSDGVPKAVVGTEVLVTRNPCLHPGDLQAVQHDRLSHLIDCIVFSTEGKRPSADLMSGGELDGDKFFVAWDPDLIPSKVSQAASYQGPKEPLSLKPVTHDDRLVYFARYTNASLGRVKNLYLDWARLKEAMSAECQELNHLFSRCVDNNRIKVPKHLEDPPRPDPGTPPFILDILCEQAGVTPLARNATLNPVEMSLDRLYLILGRDDVAFSEFELLQMTMRWCARNFQSMEEFFDYFDFSKLTDAQKVWLVAQFPAKRRPGIDDSSFRAIEDRGDQRRVRHSTIEAGINAELIISVALAKFRGSLAKYMGRVNREPIMSAEVYVISNRDSASMQVLDKWLEFIDTREVMPLFEKQEQNYRMADMKDVDWTSEPEYLKRIAKDGDLTALDSLSEPPIGGSYPEGPGASSNKHQRGHGRGQRGGVRGNGRDSARGHGRVEPRLEAFLSSSNLDNTHDQSIDTSQHTKTSQTTRNGSEWYKEDFNRHQLASPVSSEIANEMQVFVVEPLRTFLLQVRHIPLSSFGSLVRYICLVVRFPETALDLLTGVLEFESSRLLVGRPTLIRYFVANLIGVALEHTDEAKDSRASREDELQLKFDSAPGMGPNGWISMKALHAALDSSVTCLWGPPGTGKTHTVAVILEELPKDPEQRILVTAPTHNAVDNVMRKFLYNMQQQTIWPGGAVRVSIDVRKVAEDLRKHTCDAMMGKDLDEDPASRRKAQKRIKDCRLIITTCIGAALGLLKSEVFDTVIIDEASQQTEPQSLVPLTKGCTKAILVGDHVQLRATIQQHAQLVGFDVSMFKRLYNCPTDEARLRKVMLDTQYRMQASICQFSSQEFYENKLSTAVRDAERPLMPRSFPWPEPKPEKLNRQAALCRAICKALQQPPETTFSGAPPDAMPSIAVLAPYARQVETLKDLNSPNLVVISIDGFQGREADVVVYCTTRCNVHANIGFLKDLRRLNVVLARARSDGGLEKAFGGDGGDGVG
ncbi:MAG: hypothetical protein Q9192_003192 [Flavoplaca navasiana]